jgi:hypothetical protein
MQKLNAFRSTIDHHVAIQYFPPPRFIFTCTSVV